MRNSDCGLRSESGGVRLFVGRNEQREFRQIGIYCRNCAELVPAYILQRLFKLSFLAEFHDDTESSA